MSDQHTPGPWYEAKMGNDHQGLVVDEKTGANVAVVYDKANARLIAAAPETTEALADLVEQLEGIGIPDWAGAEGLDLTQAKAAIAKARPA